MRAAFGWAVLALFGQRPKGEQTALSAVVAAAAAWPVLIVGVIFPKIATLLVAFVPLSKNAPTFFVRLVWIGAALIVPVTLGFVLTRKSRPADRPHGLAGVAQGFQLTVALAAAFCVILVTTPISLLAAALRRRESHQVPLVVEIEGYDDLSRQVERALTQGGIDVAPRQAPWRLSAPTRVLRKLGGPVFKRQLPEALFYLRGPELELIVTPNGVNLTGTEGATSHARGLIAERSSETKALQTMEPDAQQLEREIKEVWAVLRANPSAHEHSRILERRVQEIGAGIAKASVSWEDWQVLYREALQLDRALGGRTALLARRTTEEKMPNRQTDSQADPKADPHTDPRSLSTGRLISEIAGTAKLLFTTEVELAKAEAKSDLTRTLNAAEWLGVAALLAVLSLSILLVAAVFGLATVMPAWLAALVVGGALLLAAGVVGAVGWGRRVKLPMEATRRTLKEDLQWLKNHAA